MTFMNDKIKEFEVMAPVGSRESLAAAIQAGADSVYFGIGKLNMRSHSANHFTIDDLREIAATCNEHGIKTYLTVNTVIYDDDIATMKEIIDAAKEAGISAVIASDVAVPLIIEKIIRKKVFPKIQNNRMRMLLHMPVINKKVREKICDQVTQAFGGNFYEIIIGGAAFNKEVENFLHSIGFRYTVGYGATECAPIICYEDYKNFVPGSCGKAALHMMVRIDSPDPENVPGEILAKGPNVMLGYYKNEEATKQTIDENGWYHTGDLGTMDGDGNVFIKGRSKNMLLGANGQNIYPEEIEDKLNSLALVAESVVVQKGDKLIALVHPDYDEAQTLNLGAKELADVMEQNRQELNTMIPAYSKVSEIRIHEDEFEKTPKKSIKRFLYTAE